MTPRGQLLKYIAALNPQALPERLAFYNFLLFLTPDSETLTTQDINFFFENALDYPHWQQNKNPLGQEVLKILEAAQRNIGLPINLAEIMWPFETQMIEVQSAKDLSEALSKNLEGQKFRLVSDQGKRILGIILCENGDVKVHQYDRKMVIRNGGLAPLREQLNVTYDKNLELKIDSHQHLEIAPYTLARFSIEENEVYGGAVRGYLFQKISEFKGGHLSHHLKLFFALKKLEQYFIDRRTDNFYQDLVSSLENTIALADLGPTEQALNNLHRAELALEQVFTGDKLLSLLVRTLQTELKSKYGPKDLTQ